jgi:tetratricopeptide (TPR) repeat protein
MLEPYLVQAHAHPHDQQALSMLSEKAFAARDRLDALRALRAAVRLTEQPNAGLLADLGLCERTLGLYTDSKRTYERLIALAPQRSEGYIGVCYALTAAGHPEGTRFLERASTALSRQDTQGRLAVAHEFDNRLAPARALQELRLAHDAKADDPDINLALAQEQLKLQDFTSARQRVEALLARDPDLAPAHRLLAELLSDPGLPQREPALAEHHFIAGLRSDPRDMQAWQELGNLYFASRRFHQAAYTYTRLLYLAPDSAAARFPLARCYSELGDRQTAAEQQLIAERLLARNRAEDHLRNQRKIRPADVGVRIALMRRYQEEGAYARALHEVQSAYCLAPRDANVRAAMTPLYHQLNIRMPEREEPAK